MFTLHKGDCLQYMRSLPSGSVSAIITDPPYGMNKDFENDTPEQADALFEAVCVEAKRICTGNFLAFWSAQRMDKIAQFKPKRVLIWNKTFAIYTPHNVGYRYEPIFWMFGETAYNKIGDIIEGYPILFKSQHENESHPTQKPLEVMKKIIENFTLPDDIVFDPFTGSGSTGVAALQLGRRFIGCELKAEYHAIAEKRLQQAVLSPSLFTPSNNRLHLTGGTVPAQGDLFTPEDLPSEGKLPAPSPRR